jgi:hypothetical protein
MPGFGVHTYHHCNVASRVGKGVCDGDILAFDDGACCEVAVLAALRQLIPRAKLCVL